MEERWEYKTASDWRVLLYQFVVETAQGWQAKDVDLLCEMEKTIEHLERHGNAISSHHRYELNGILNGIVYDLTH